jgi:phage gp29-like protein
MAKMTPALLQPKAATAQELGQDLAAPEAPIIDDSAASGRTRKAIEDVAVELTPAAALRALRNAKSLSNVPDFVNKAMEVLRRDPNLQSLLQTRVLAVSGLELLCEPTGKKLADKKAAEYVQDMLQSEYVEGILPHLLLNGVYLGFSVAQKFVDTSVQPWTITSIADVDSSFITFSKHDARTPLLFPAEPGGTLQPLAQGKFIYHRPGLISGNPATSSIAYTALFYYALKQLSLMAWADYIELFGVPVRVGKYAPGTGNTAQGKKDLAVLRRALQDLGGDAWAMLPENMKIELLESAQRTSSTDMYEKHVRFLDEQIAKLVLGGSLTSGTGNTGSGGSQGLGVVHNELRIDILKADAKSLATTLRRDLVKWQVQWNFGPTVAVPRVYFQIEEAEDVQAKVEAVCQLMDRGFVVPSAEMYNLLDIRAPEGDEETIGGLTKAPEATPAPAAADQALTARFAAQEGERDELDDLGDALLAEDGYSLADAEADDLLLAAIENATNADELKAALLKAVKTGNVEGLQSVFTAGLTAARLTGESGVEVGDK